MPGLSVTDLTVAGQGGPLFGLLWQLPLDMVLDFLEQANTWEMRHGLADRLADHTELIRPPVAATPSLSGRSDQIAQQCADFVFRSNAMLCALIAQLERSEQSPLAVEWIGLDHLQQARTGGRPVVVFAPHMGFLYAVPVALAARGERSAVLGGAVAKEVLLTVSSALAMRLVERIDYLVVPSPGCARAAVETLRRGDLLVMFPEVNRGATGNLQSATMSFLGRTIWVPTTAARFARITGADIVPVMATPVGARRVQIELGEPIPPPADRRADVDTSLRLFGWLERVVVDRPHLWWGWPMLDTDMRVAEAPGRG